MILDNLLRQTEVTFSQAGIGDARIEADVIWMTALSLDRPSLYAELTTNVTSTANNTAQKLIRRRLAGEPSAYLTGFREFYNINLHIQPGVLIPRQETETVIDEALQILGETATNTCTKIADVGCGSGAISIAIGVNYHRCLIYASDISHTAMVTTEINSRRHNLEARIRLLHGNLLDILPEPVDMIVANLPYVTSSEIPTLMREVRLFEPLNALDGGQDGLDVIKALIEQSPPHLLPGGAIILEIDPRQLSEIQEAAARSFPDAKIRWAQDMTGCDRVVIIQT